MHAILDELTNPTVVDIDGGRSGLDHLYCECDKTRSLCGKVFEDDVEDVDLDDVDEDYLCVVCDDLDNYPCPNCGWAPQE